MKITHWLVILIGIFLGLVSDGTSEARTWTILPDGTGDAPTIQAGIDSAAVGDVVEVECGLYLEHGLTMKSGITLRSSTEDPDCVFVHAQQQSRVISCQGVGEDTEISGFSFTGGLAPDEENGSLGGGMLCQESQLSISHCRFEANLADFGGGMICLDSNPVITGCTFTSNISEYGGGMYCNNSDPTISDCWFTEHLECVDGGGLYCNRSSPLVTYCVFTNNDALVWGGAVFCHNSSSPHLSQCTLFGNSAHWGAGIWCVAESYPVLENTIVAFSQEGEGVYVYDNPSHPSAVTLSCCDVFGNAGGEYGGAIEDQTGINGNISADPFFCGPWTEDFTLDASSPCLPENNECDELIGAFGEGCTVVWAPERPGPVRITLDPCFPNPFNPVTRLSFSLPEEFPTKLAIYSLAGKPVSTLVQRQVPAGIHKVFWNGRDDQDRQVPSGVYLCRLEAGAQVATRHLTLLK